LGEMEPSIFDMLASKSDHTRSRWPVNMSKARASSMKLAWFIAEPGRATMTSNHRCGGVWASTKAISRIFEASRSQVT
jgi:hypothetical protein